MCCLLAFKPGAEKYFSGWLHSVKINDWITCKNSSSNRAGEIYWDDDAVLKYRFFTVFNKLVTADEKSGVRLSGAFRSNLSAAILFASNPIDAPKGFLVCRKISRAQTEKPLAHALALMIGNPGHSVIIVNFYHSKLAVRGSCGCIQPSAHFFSVFIPFGRNLGDHQAPWLEALNGSFFGAGYPDSVALWRWISAAVEPGAKCR